MKTVILAGGKGTRLAEETELKPKPMVEIGGRPIVWHIMHHYSAFGFNEFCVALGYRSEVLKRFFVDYHALSASITVHLKTGMTEVHGGCPEDWIVHLIETGGDTNTGGRVKRLARFLGMERFMITYGDGVANINLTALIAFHEKCGKLATITAVRPPARFGGLAFHGDQLLEFNEKPQIGEGWINGGFMVLEPEVLDMIGDDDASLESDVLEKLARDGQLAAYRHNEFWQCMDTLRDKRVLDSLWESGRAPWKAPA